MSDILDRLLAMPKQVDAIRAYLGDTARIAVLVNANALKEGSVDLRIEVDVPVEMAPADAQRIGYALYVIGSKVEEANGQRLEADDADINEE